MHRLATRLAAEALGTFLFFFLGFSGIAAAVEYGIDAIGPVGVAAGFGFGVALAVTAFGHFSGGHFNPAVTASWVIAGQLRWRDLLPYWIAQIVGGLSAVGTIALVFDEQVQNALATVPGSGIDEWGALVLEFVATTLFVMVILAVAKDTRAPWSGVMAPLMIGLFIFTAGIALGPATGGSFNPARSFVPVFYNNEWGDLWIYLVGPLAGGVLGGWIWSWFFRPREELA